MSGLDLDTIEARANAATLGPWVTHPTGPHMAVSRATEHAVVVLADAGATIADITFVIHARTDVPNLVARVRHLEALLAPVQEAAREYRKAKKHTFESGDALLRATGAALATIEETPDAP